MFNKNSVLFKWLISYLVLIILFIIVMVSIYSTTRDIVLKQIDAYNTIQLKRIVKDPI